MCELFGAVKEGEGEEDFIAQLNTTPADGTQPPDIIDLCTRRGLAVTSGHMEVDDFRKFFRRGWPVICPVEMYGPGLDHYICVIGVGLGQVFYHDPARVEGREGDNGRAMMSEEDFLSIWFDREGEVPAADAAYRQYGIAIGQLAEDDDTARGLVMTTSRRRRRPPATTSKTSPPPRSKARTPVPVRRLAPARRSRASRPIRHWSVVA